MVWVSSSNFVLSASEILQFVEIGILVLSIPRFGEFFGEGAYFLQIISVLILTINRTRPILATKDTIWTTGHWIKKKFSAGQESIPETVTLLCYANVMYDLCIGRTAYFCSRSDSGKVLYFAVMAVRWMVAYNSVSENQTVAKLIIQNVNSFFFEFLPHHIFWVDYCTTPHMTLCYRDFSILGSIGVGWALKYKKCKNLKYFVTDKSISGFGFHITFEFLLTELILRAVTRVTANFRFLAVFTFFFVKMADKPTSSSNYSAAA